MVKSKNKFELALMEKSGRIAAKALKKAIEAIKPGVRALDLDKIAALEIKRLGGDFSYKTVPGYRFATCVTINEQVVHGIPTGRKTQEGDLVSMDLAVMYKGWHTDCAWTKLVSGQGTGDRVQSEKPKFLKVGEEALWDGIAEAVEGRTVGDIGAAIQEKVEGLGYHVVRSLVGHGVGKSLHEDPEVPGYGKAGTGLVLASGMTLAIEVIYAKGTPDVVLEKDGWTYSTADGSISGLFEMTVVVGKKKPKVLTRFTP